MSLTERRELTVPDGSLGERALLHVLLAHARDHRARPIYGYIQVREIAAAGHWLMSESSATQPPNTQPEGNKSAMTG